MEGAADEAAVERVLAGDPGAFRLLVERHGALLFRLAYRITGNEHDAEDAVQEGLVKAYRNLAQFDARAPVRSWLCRIVSNAALDLLRRRARRPEEPLQSESESEELPGSAQPHLDRLVFGAQVQRRLHWAMNRLSATERTAFALRHYEGLSSAEIGGALGIDANAAKQSVFRAVRKLRLALRPLVTS